MYLNDNFTELNFIDVIDSLNNMSLKDLKSKVIILKNIPSGEFKFSNPLGKIPEFRIILKQIGGGYITDSDKTNDKMIYLNNSGGTISEIQIMVG